MVSSAFTHARGCCIIACSVFSGDTQCSKSALFPPALKTCKSARTRLGGTFDYDTKRERLVEVERELEAPEVWNDPERAQALGRERAQLENVVSVLSQMKESLDEALELLEMAAEENDLNGRSGW